MASNKNSNFPSQVYLINLTILMRVFLKGNTHDFSVACNSVDKSDILKELRNYKRKLFLCLPRK